MKKTAPFQLNFRLFENLVYTILWLIIFSFPFFHYQVYGTIVLEKVLKDWITIFGLWLVFVLNVYVFVPRFLFQKHYLKYALMILICSGFIVFLTLSLHETVTDRANTKMPPMEIGPGMPPMELSSGMPPPKGFSPSSDQVKESVFVRFFSYMLIAILVVAASTSFKLFSRWINEERKNEKLENERLKNELVLLRNQVSPHFLMNTLNNIHALILLDPPTAMDAVIRLSTLMRYLLYDTSAEKTSLHQEIIFIESYFSLMKLRFSKEIDLKMEVPKEIPNIAIPPMLFISFLENAFKHGVSYDKKSFVHFHLEINDSRLNCTIQNSLHPNIIKANNHYSGIGLSNVKKSLELLYPNDFTLDIDQNNQQFSVFLSIPI